MKRRTLMTVLAAAAVGGCARPRQVALAGITMGTTYSVRLTVDTDEQNLTELRAAIERELELVNRAMSSYDAHSELSRLNRERAAEWIPVSPALFDVVDAATQISERSGGAFDATVGPLIDLWGFGPQLRERQVPSRERIARAHTLVGYRQLQGDSRASAIRKARGGVQLDLSSIAKGHGVDQVATLLDTRGVANYLVDIGGDLRSKGVNADGQAWRIAIEAPVPGQRRPASIVAVSNRGIATSGNYRDFFERDGRRYSHVIDPRTAWPVRHPLISVTVVARSAMEADALATALLVLGPEDGLRLAQATRLAALFMVPQGAAFRNVSSDGFQAFSLA